MKDKEKRRAVSIYLENDPILFAELVEVADRDQRTISSTCKILLRWALNEKARDSQ